MTVRTLACVCRGLLLREATAAVHLACVVRPHVNVQVSRGAELQLANRARVDLQLHVQILVIVQLAQIAERQSALVAVELGQVHRSPRCNGELSHAICHRSGKSRVQLVRHVVAQEFIGILELDEADAATVYPLVMIGNHVMQVLLVDEKRHAAVDATIGYPLGWVQGGAQHSMFYQIWLVLVDHAAQVTGVVVERIAAHVGRAQHPVVWYPRMLD